MGEAFITARGGGTAGLNFKVVGGTSAPSNPAGNTIWVNTDTEITSWAFMATAPASPTNGMVWFKTSFSSRLPFNALKKNIIQVLPSGCQQYVDGAWIAKVAETYQNNVWIDWRTYLYAQGDSDASNWTKHAIQRSNATESKGAPTLSFESDGLVVTAAGSSKNGFACRYIDLTKATTLMTEVQSISSGASNTSAEIQVRTGVSTSDSQKYNGSDRVAYMLLHNEGTNTVDAIPGVYSIDVSGLSGMHYVGLNVYSTGCAVKIANMWLE